MPSSLLYYGLGYLFYDRPVAEFWLFNTFYVGQKKKASNNILMCKLDDYFSVNGTDITFYSNFDGKPTREWVMHEAGIVGHQCKLLCVCFFLILFDLCAW